jgi:uncharacterized spore protein YtfJ
MGPARPFAVIRRVLRARDVFGKPVKSGGVTVIPVASVVGGGGGGAGGGQTGDGPELQDASGVGFGFRARPVGAFVISDGRATWKPALDVTQLALGAAVFGGLAVAGWALRNRG